MTTYKFTVHLKTDDPAQELTEEEMEDITNVLLRLNAWAEVTLIGCYQ